MPADGGGNTHRKRAPSKESKERDPKKVSSRKPRKKSVKKPTPARGDKKGAKAAAWDKKPTTIAKADRIEGRYGREGTDHNSGICRKSKRDAHATVSGKCYRPLHN